MFKALMSVAGSAAMAMVTSLMTEEMMKWAIMWAMRKLVKSTKNTWDDELMERMEAEWKRESSK